MLMPLFSSIFLSFKEKSGRKTKKNEGKSILF